MGQTNSAHEIAEHDNIEDAAVAGLKLNLRDYRRGYGDWDHTLILCGPLADIPESMRKDCEPDDEWEPDRHVDLTQLPEYKAAHAEAKRQIAESIGVARSTVADYLCRAEMAALAWPLPDDVDDEARHRLLFRDHEFAASPTTSTPFLTHGIAAGRPGNP